MGSNTGIVSSEVNAKAAVLTPPEGAPSRPMVIPPAAHPINMRG